MPASRDKIYARVVKMLSDSLSVKETNIDESKVLRTDLGADSLDLVEFSMDVEQEFHLTVEDSDLEKIVTVKDLVDYIESRLKETPSSPKEI